MARVWIAALLVLLPLVWGQATEEAPEPRSPYYPPPPPPPPRPYPPPPPPQQQGGQFPPQHQQQLPPPPPAQQRPPQAQQRPPPPPPQAGGGGGASGGGSGGGGGAGAGAGAGAGGYGPVPGPAGQAGAGPAMPMAVVDTEVTCQSRNMRVEFSMSAPFHGIIYPYNHFHNCLLHEGNGETHVSLLLGHGTCANENGLQSDGTLAPVIEHRLMIQWDREIVEEWDSSIIVRCDRPEDYNKTIRFDLSTLDEAASFVSSTHPGPQMWMEIQKGEGPNAPELQGSVFLGQVLTLVFTLADEHFDFDTNVLTCWALDGETEKRRIEWLTPQAGGGGGGGGGGTQLIQQRRYTGEMEVINQGCSAKPKVFGHFNKVTGNFNNKQSTTQYAFFKAFRFPTSARVVIQCNVQVCYRKCHELRPCSESYHPRAALSGDAAASRRRRQADEPADERVNLVRSIEVRLPEEAADLPDGDLPPLATSRVRYTPSDGLHCPQCTSLTTFFIVLVSLAALLAALVSAALWVYVRRQHGCSSLSTPTK